MSLALPRRAFVAAASGVAAARRDWLAGETAALGPRAAAAAPVVARDGTALFTRVWGDGPPVVFVHGWALDSRFWHAAMLRMTARGYRGIAYDSRGHGRSGDAGRGYDYDTLADDLASVLDTLDVGGATLVAHSMGGGVVVRYLTRHGARRISRIALVGATLPYMLRAPDNPDGKDRAVFDAWRARLSDDFPQWLADNEDPFWTPETSRTMKEWGRVMAFDCSLQAVVECTHAITESDLRAELRAIRRPTLFVHGARDRSVDVRFARAAADLVPGARLLEYADGPHGLPITHAERLATDLLAFIRG